MNQSFGISNGIDMMKAPAEVMEGTLQQNCSAPRINLAVVVPYLHSNNPPYVFIGFTNRLPWRGIQRAEEDSSANQSNNFKKSLASPWIKELVELRNVNEQSTVTSKSCTERCSPFAIANSAGSLPILMML